MNEVNKGHTILCHIGLLLATVKKSLSLSKRPIYFALSFQSALRRLFVWAGTKETNKRDTNAGASIPLIVREKNQEINIC